MHDAPGISNGQGQSNKDCPQYANLFACMMHAIASRKILQSKYQIIEHVQVHPSCLHEMQNQTFEMLPPTSF